MLTCTKPTMKTKESMQNNITWDRRATSVNEKIMGHGSANIVKAAKLFRKLNQC